MYVIPAAAYPISIQSLIRRSAFDSQLYHIAFIADTYVQIFMSQLLNIHKQSSRHMSHVSQVTPGCDLLGLTHSPCTVNVYTCNVENMLEAGESCSEFQLGQ